MKKTRVLLVDDHPLLRKGVALLIGSHKAFEVCGEVEQAKHLAETIQKTKPEIIVMDITMKDGSGIELLKDVQVQFPKIKVLMLSMHDENIYAPRALRAGAAGYITKEEAPERIIAALVKISRGGTYLSERMAKLVSSIGQAPKAESPVERLSDRELEVLLCWGKGLEPGRLPPDLTLA